MTGLLLSSGHPAPIGLYGRGMASEEAVFRSLIDPDETVVFIQRGGVNVGALDQRTGQPIPLETYGTGKGWIGVSSARRLTYGYFASFGRARAGGTFTFTDWSADPRGIVFFNTGVGPEDICVFVPASIAPDALHGHLREVFGEPSRPDSVDDDRDVDEVRYLQQVYASRVAQGAGILADFSEINKVYAALRDLGADADQSLVDAAKAAFGGSPYGSSYEPHLDSEAFDQRRANGELILDLDDDYEPPG